MKILLITLDQYSHINYFPLGIGYVASYLRSKNISVDICHQNIYHYPDSYIRELIDFKKYDIVGMGVFGYQLYKKCVELCQELQKCEHKPKIVLGSNGPTAAPLFFINKTNADFVVMEDGEIVFYNLINALENNTSLENVNGIAYKKDGKLIINEKEKLISDLNSIPFPAWDMFPMEHYILDKHISAKHTDRCMAVMASRGCPYNCNFCHRICSGYRKRSVQNVIDEIQMLKKEYDVTHINFTDENFMVTRKNAIEFSNGFIEANLNIEWDCMGRVGMAKPDILKIMKDAGCVYINYGIESVNQIVLDNMNKKQTVEEIYDGLHNTMNAGIIPGLNILWGSPVDNVDTLENNMNFLIKYNSTRQVRTVKPITPYPGTKYFDMCIEKGLLKDVEDFYNKYQNSDRMTVNMTNLSDDEFYSNLFVANKNIVESYYEKVSNDVVDGFKKCYLEHDINFRGPRHR